MANHIYFRTLTLLAFVAASFLTSFAQCTPKPEETVWLEGTIKAWKKVRSDSLKLPPAKLPWLVFFDEKCVFNVNPDAKFFKSSAGVNAQLSGEKVVIYSSQHNGKVTLPDTQVIPAQLISFAANYDNDKSSFFVAALPSIWAKAEHLRAEKDPSTLVRAVYVHELTHTYHRNFFARLSAIEKELKDIDNFDDDIIQNTFGKDEIFRKAYLDEIAMANAVAEEANIGKKRVAAKGLLAAIKKRRSDFYTGQNKKFEEVEDIFLTMEGVANWAGYRAAIGDGLDARTASKLIRRSGKNWSQEEGILLFMIIDSLLPNWQRIAFGDKRVSIVDLLERAVR
jgi:hypothetical protein